ncbi:MAG TPA: efflux RND transporter periplasmic adaptor subunit [Noviherbaspirillum sp.]|nr:efflux RND transporter periplasmic adaptor subunit [Noviherbaspirillum sp.]
MRKALLTMLFSVTSAAQADPLACMIEPEKVAEIGAPGIGIIHKITVERGDVIKAGQVLAHLRSDIERASVSVASVRAQAEADLKAAIASQDLAQAKAARARSLVDVGFISKEALDQAEAESRIAQNRVVQAQEAKQVAQKELALSNSQLAQRTIRSPFSGIVVDRYRTEGERIEREPILRVAKVDPLRVEVVLPLSQFGQIEMGVPVNIKTDIAGAQNLTATVVLIDRMVDAASNTFRVRLALPNPDHRIPAGLRCSAEFGATPVASKKQGVPRTKAAAASATVHQPAAAGIIRTGGRLSYELQNVPTSQ